MNPRRADAQPLALKTSDGIRQMHCRLRSRETSQPILMAHRATLESLAVEFGLPGNQRPFEYFAVGLP